MFILFLWRINKIAFISDCKQVIDTMDNTPSSPLKPSKLSLELTKHILLALATHTQPALHEVSTEISSLPPAWLKPDFTLSTVNGAKFECHTFVLCRQWLYFKNLLETHVDMRREKHWQLPEDWTPKRLHYFLTYLYTDNILSIDLKDKIWLYQHRETYELVDRYQQPHAPFENLMLEYKEVLLDRLCPDNCVYMYWVAQQMQDDKRIQKCRKFIIKNFKAIMEDCQGAEALGTYMDTPTIVAFLFQHYNRPLPDNTTLAASYKDS